MDKGDGTAEKRKKPAGYRFHACLRFVPRVTSKRVQGDGGGRAHVLLPVKIPQKKMMSASSLSAQVITIESFQTTVRDTCIVYICDMALTVILS